jgi:5-methylthioadenosine/S-adenosylhomocysteine deaminase
MRGIESRPLFDLLLRGATVATCDSGDRLIVDGAIGIRGDRIAFVGPASELPPHASAQELIALPERLVTPGFINVHTHAALTVVRGVAEDLGFAPAYTKGIPNSSHMTVDEAIPLARLGALEAMMFGSTLINDMFSHAEQTVAPMAELGLRVMSSERIHDADFARISSGNWQFSDAIGDQTLGAALGLAERWNGKANGRIAVQLAAHAPDTCSQPLLQRISQAASRLGLRVNTHLAQSRAEVVAVRARCNMSPAEVLEEAGLLNERLIAAHCIFLSASDIALCGRARINVAHIPKGNAAGGTIAPTVKLRDAGANIALGTDNMHADMVEAMRWALAVARIQQGEVNDGWQPRHVLRMATLAGASTLGLEKEIGSIELGKKADLVAVDFRRPHLTPAINPIGNVVHVAQGRDVDLVAVDGRVVVRDGKPTLVNAETVIADGRRAAEAVWRRAAAG